MNISIIKHENAVAVADSSGDIYFPWKNWFSTSTADNWYTKVPNDYYNNKSFYPLTAISHNPWEAMEKLNIDHFSFISISVSAEDKTLSSVASSLKMANSGHIISQSRQLTHSSMFFTTAG